MSGASSLDDTLCTHPFPLLSHHSKRAPLAWFRHLRDQIRLVALLCLFLPFAIAHSLGTPYAGSTFLGATMKHVSKPATVDKIGLKKGS